MGESWFEVAFGAHYPEIYGHRNQDEADRCLQLLPRLAPLSPRGLPVLDLGCGDGRHLASIGDDEFATVGLDLSAPLLALAAGRPDAGPLVRGDMRALPFADQSIGGVLSLFTAFGYFGPLKENLCMVREVSRVLTPGGHWFLDYFNCDRVIRELGSGEKFFRERIQGDMKISETRQYSSSLGIVSKDVHLKAIDAGHSKLDLPADGLQYTEKVAVFSLKEMDHLARLQGLVRVAGAGSYDGASLDHGDRWILVYRREDGS